MRQFFCSGALAGQRHSRDVYDKQGHDVGTGGTFSTPGSLLHDVRTPPDLSGPARSSFPRRAAAGNGPRCPPAVEPELHARAGVSGSRAGRHDGAVCRHDYWHLPRPLRWIMGDTRAKPENIRLGSLYSHGPAPYAATAWLLTLLRLGFLYSYSPALQPGSLYCYGLAPYIIKT